MNGPFAVGEIVVFRAPAEVAEHSFIPNGAECEVMEPLGQHFCTTWTASGTPEMIYGYVVFYRRWPMVVEAEYLHRKRPPAAFIGEQRVRDLFMPAPAKELEPA